MVAGLLCQDCCGEPSLIDGYVASRNIHVPTIRSLRVENNRSYAAEGKHLLPNMQIRQTDILYRHISVGGAIALSIICYVMRSDSWMVMR